MTERLSAELSPGEQKVREYANRIRAGEQKEAILEGLPPSFREGIERALAIDGEVGVYSPESTSPYDDGEQARVDNEQISAILRDLGVVQNSEGHKSEEDVVVTMNQDQFADWLVENLSPEDARRIDVYTLLTVRPENRLAFIRDALSLGEQELVERRIAMLPQLRAWATQAESVLHAHKEGEITGVSGTGWNHFVINEGQAPKMEDRAKGYMCLNGEGVLEKFTPLVMEDILETLRARGYHGQVKFPMTGGQLFDKFDNIVVHGNTDEETQLALGIIQEVLTRHAVLVNATQYGKDGVGEDGKKTSHSDLLANEVSRKINAR